MKTTNSLLKAHLGQETTTLAYLIRIARRDGTVMGFTTHDTDLVYSGLTYKAQNSFTASSIESHSDLSTDNLSAVGILSSADISETDLLLGKYDHAAVDVYLCNWSDMTQGVMQIRKGWFGEVTTAKGKYSVEIKGLHDKLQRTVGSYFTAECRHDLGDALCQVNLASTVIAGTVDEVVSPTQIYDYSNSSLLAMGNDYYNYGKLTWTSGNNIGLSMEVKGFIVDGGWLTNISIWMPMPHTILVNDNFTLTAGCDKRFATCKNKFNNITNFGGFPHMPGIDQILLYPDSRS